MVCQVFYNLILVFNPMKSSFYTNDVRVIRGQFNRKMRKDNKFDLLYLSFKSLFAFNAYKEVHVNVSAGSEHLNH